MKKTDARESHKGTEDSGRQPMMMITAQITDIITDAVLSTRRGISDEEIIASAVQQARKLFVEDRKPEHKGTGEGETLDEALEKLHTDAALKGLVNDGKPHAMYSHANGDGCVTEAKSKIMAWHLLDNEEYAASALDDVLTEGSDYEALGHTFDYKKALISRKAGLTNKGSSDGR